MGDVGHLRPPYADLVQLAHCTTELAAPGYTVNAVRGRIINE